MLAIYEFDVLKDMELFLQGGISGGKDVRNQQGGVIFGLHNRTLIFTTPVATVTFADPTGAGLTTQQVTAQIVAASATLRSFWREGRLHLLRTPGTNAAVVLSAAGTANSLFGFSNSAAATGTYYNGPSGATPRVVETNNKSRLDGYYVIVEQ